jgi:hypothetical protein
MRYGARPRRLSETYADSRSADNGLQSKYRNPFILLSPLPSISFLAVLSSLLSPHATQHAIA